MTLFILVLSAVKYFALVECRVDDDILCFFVVCFAMLVALCWAIFEFELIWVSIIVCVFLLRGFLLSSLVFSVTQPITIM